MYIYKITNLVNGKLYIGQTIHEPQKRWLSHLNAAKNSPKLSIQYAIRKYGACNFSFEVIDNASSLDELNEKEKYWIEKLNTIQEGYNIKAGGDCNPMNVLSIRERHDAVMRSPEVRSKISQTMKKIKASGISEETRKKLSQAAMGNKKGLGKKRSEAAVIATAEKNKKEVTAVDMSGNIYTFGSVREAAIWWKEHGNDANIGTIMAAIKRSDVKDIFIYNLKWKYTNGGDKNE